MITVNWHSVLLGFSVGLPVGALFFLGLAWGMRRALGSDRPGLWLIVSAFCRISVLLTVGAWVIATAESNWAVAGYALAFFLARLIAVLWARAGRTSANTGQESA